ncbi:MAG: hypothetical protein KIT79_03765 [Deltaproteobacteria bacterium]|nr:hypothetical protein [Deltaproteobacteria bacterium]
MRFAPALPAVFLLAVLPVQAAGPAAFDPAGPAAKGKPYRAESEGAEITIPSGWNYRETDDGLLLGSDTEPGLLFVWMSRARSAADAGREMSGALSNTGGRFGPLAGPASAKLAAGEAHYADASGAAQDGTPLQARLVAVAGAGATVMVGGVTTPEQFAGLRSRVDQMARSVKFFAVDRNQAQAAVSGQWWSYSGVSGVSGGGGGSEHTLAFCPGGQFREQRESGYHGSGWGTASSGGGAGRWEASGTRQSGTVRVVRSDGSLAEFSYSAKTPDDLSFNGRAYGRVHPALCQ